MPRTADGGLLLDYSQIDGQALGHCVSVPRTADGGLLQLLLCSGQTSREEKKKVSVPRTADGGLLRYLSPSELFAARKVSVPRTADGGLLLFLAELADLSGFDPVSVPRTADGGLLHACAVFKAGGVDEEKVSVPRTADGGLLPRRCSPTTWIYPRVSVPRTADGGLLLNWGNTTPEGYALVVSVPRTADGGLLRWPVISTPIAASSRFSAANG